MLWISLVLAGEWAQLPPDPRCETDFTAYTLEPGRARLGLVNLDVGVLPHDLGVGGKIRTFLHG